jgi:hypothetical protein
MKLKITLLIILFGIGFLLPGIGSTGEPILSEATFFVQ